MYGMLTIFLIGLCIIANKKKYRFNRELKKCESPIEEKMLKELYQKGVNPYSQVKCGPYRIDISIFHKGVKIAIECDGKAFHSSDEQLAHDNKKNQFLEKRNWRVYRFSGKRIYHEAEKCVAEILTR